MRTIFLFGITCLLTAITFAQGGINYKALIKDSNGDAFVNQAISVQFQILEDGTIVSYQESHNTSTDNNGIVIINIGEGTPQTGIFDEIDWATADHFLNVQVDTGVGLVDLGTTAFTTVPYANFAEDTRKGTLNDSYNKGGLGEGRIIDAQNGKVEITGDGLFVETEIGVGDKLFQKDNSETAIEFSPNSLTLKTEGNSGVFIDKINKEVIINNDEDQVNFIVRTASNDTAIYTDGTTGSVGLGTDTPEGVLDIVTTNDTGIVIPRVSNVENVTDGNGNPPVNGTLVYDLSKNAICFYIDAKWTCGGFDSTQGGITFDNTEGVYENTQLYFKSDIPNADDEFGFSIAISDDGNTLAIGAPFADNTNSGSTEVNAGRVVMYRKINNIWSYLRSHIPISSFDEMNEVSFGYSVSLNADGSKLAVGAPNQNHKKGFYTDCSSFPTVNFNEFSLKSGAVWIYDENGVVCHVTAINVDSNDGFGNSVSLDNTGNRLVVGSRFESSSATGIDGDTNDNSASNSGAAYVFDIISGAYIQTAYIKASNTGAEDRFGTSISISGNGEYIIIGAQFEESASIGMNGDQSNNSLNNAGAAYVFYDNGGTWEEQAYIKQRDVTTSNNFFGYSVSIDDTGSRIAISAYGESGLPLGNNGDTNTTSFNPGSGAVYTLIRTGSTWNYEAYLRASHTASAGYGLSVALSGDGETLLVGAPFESSNALGINPLLNNGTVNNSGAGFLYTFTDNAWQFTAHIKATTAINEDDFFGYAAALNNDGSIIALSASREDGSSPFMSGNQNDNNTQDAGAVYLYEN